MGEYRCLLVSTLGFGQDLDTVGHLAGHLDH